MTIQTLFNHFSKHKEGAWIMQPYNLPLLYDLVKNNPIKRVLDLGTGIGLSSSVIALALKDKGEKGHVDTVEQFDKCIKIAEKLIPEELKEYITIHKGGPKIWHNPEIPYQPFSTFENPPYMYESNHEKEPKLAYDLIIVDGPGPWQEEGKLIDFPNGDIMKMLVERKLKPNTLIAYDGRIQSLQLLERYYGDNFFMHQIAPKGTDFNVLKRKDNEVVFRDIRYELMGKAYFDEENTISSDSKTSLTSPNTSNK